MPDLGRYIREDLVAFLEAESRDKAIDELIDLLVAKGKVTDKKAFLEAVLSREKIVSTGIGMGVAIPHAKLPDYSDFFIAVGIQKKGIPWDSLDGAPVRLILLVGGPDDKQTEYLQLLSRLTVSLKDRERRKNLLTSEEAATVVEHLVA